MKDLNEIKALMEKNPELVFAGLTTVEYKTKAGEIKSKVKQHSIESALETLSGYQNNYFEYGRCIDPERMEKVYGQDQLIDHNNIKVTKTLYDVYNPKVNGVKPKFEISFNENVIRNFIPYHFELNKGIQNKINKDTKEVKQLNRTDIFMINKDFSKFINIIKPIIYAISKPLISEKPEDLIKNNIKQININKKNKKELTANTKVVPVNTPAESLAALTAICEHYPNSALFIPTPILTLPIIQEAIELGRRTEIASIEKPLKSVQRTSDIFNKPMFVNGETKTFKDYCDSISELTSNNENYTNLTVNIYEINDKLENYKDISKNDILDEYNRYSEMLEPILQKTAKHYDRVDQSTYKDEFDNLGKSNDINFKEHEDVMEEIDTNEEEKSIEYML